ALFMQALELALLAAKVTDGDVDPTLGRALELAGYRTDWRLLPIAGDGGEPPIVSARARAAWEAVALDRARSSVRLPPGVQLDLGATAKAWAADRAAAAAAAATGSGALVSLGGDIATSGTAPAGGWLIHVTDDHRSDPTAPGQTISIRSGGLATSSTSVRRWRSRGLAMHHIIDPATHAPARTPWAWRPRTARRRTSPLRPRSSAGRRLRAGSRRCGSRRAWSRATDRPGPAGAGRRED